MTFHLTREDRGIVIKIVAVYTLYGGLWIYLSDSILGWLVRDPDLITRIATYKGLLFIATTAALLYYLIGRFISRLTEFNRRLHADEIRFRAIVATTSDGFYATDREGRFLDVNHAFCRDIGYGEHELLTMGIREIEALESEAEIATHIARIIATGSDRFESKHRRKDGSLMDVEVCVTYQPDQERFYSFVRDITERKNIEKQLRLTSFTINSISDAVYWVAADSRVLDVNDAACRMVGYSRDEIMAMHVADIDPNFPSETWAQHWEQLKKTGNLKLETIHRTRDGRIIDVEVTTNYFRYLDTEYNCAMVRDISERKRTEHALRESEETMRSLMELMPVGVAWANEHGDIEYVNRTFVEMFGYPLNEIPTVKEWYRKAYPDASYCEELTSAWKTHIDEYRAHGTPIPPLDAKVTCKDGTQRHTIANTQLSHQRILVIFTDITERKNQQEELLKQQKLESIGVLAGGIAHDFNNILTAIMGNISFAAMFIGRDHKAEAPLLQAEKAAKRAAELAHQLLTFAKGGQPVTRSVEARQLIEESLSLVLRGSNVQSRVEIEEGLRTIEADAGQISQAFNNLIINAVQAMPGGGTITIRAANAQLDETNPFGLPSGAYVRILFEDEGCGIPSEYLHNIFDPYFTTKSGGSGLGLASVHSIATKHGGHISVRSAINRGTVFELLLPAGNKSPVVPAVLPAPAICDNPEAPARMALLVMDDEEMIRELAANMLKELGYRVTTCANGEEAVALYKATLAARVPFAAAIMDLTIPGGMGGREAARAILDIDPQARLIVSSGYSSDPIMSDYRRYGFSAAILKPYGVAEIAEVLKSLLTDAASQK